MVAEAEVVKDALIWYTTIKSQPNTTSIGGCPETE